MWINRIHIDPIKEALKTRPAVLLTGIRQAGKSSLLKHLLPHTEYITLDKVIYAEEAETNPSRFLDRFQEQVIIDEVQYAPSLFRELKVRIDEDRSQKGKWILTGSQQFNLTQHVSESLAGRIRILNLGTLNAHEIHSSGLNYQTNDLLWRGGFPELWAENLPSQVFYEDYIQTYFERDLKQLINIANLRDFRRFIALAAIRTGQLLNYSELSKEVGIAVNTVKSWINALEISGIVVLIPPYYNNLGKRLIKAPKLYFCDNGLIAALLNISSSHQLENSPFMGALWENFTLTECIKAGLMPGKNIFYYRDQNGVEIDFILETQGKTLLIEAKNSERPNSRKLNFSKVQPRFKVPCEAYVACGIQENSAIHLKDYSLYNPLQAIYPWK